MARKLRLHIENPRTGDALCGVWSSRKEDVTFISDPKQWADTPNVCVRCSLSMLSKRQKVLRRREDLRDRMFHEFWEDFKTGLPNPESCAAFDDAQAGFNHGFEAAMDAVDDGKLRPM